VPVVLRDESGQEYRVTAGADGQVTVNDVPFTVRTAADGTIHVEGPRNALVWAVASDRTAWVFIDGHVFTFEIAQQIRRRRAAGYHGTLSAPMPATVRKVAVAPGDAVRHGDVLIVLEAMKMELPVRAPADGTVEAVNCREGDMVQAGQELVEMA
jgi:biotin carboxyl carrier protein